MEREILIPAVKRWLYRTPIPVGLLAALAACKSDRSRSSADLEDTATPHLASLSVSEVSLGQPIDLIGMGLNGGIVSIRVRGTFETDISHKKIPVDVTLDDLQRVDPTTLRWDTFGPFCPQGKILGDCTETGVLKAQWTAIKTILNTNQKIFDATPSRFSLRVLPSVVFDEFQPIETTCGEPVTQVFSGLRYHTSVRAIGFVPTDFTYTLTTATEGTDPAKNAASPPVVVRHGAGSEGRDQVEGDEAFFLRAPVPEANGAYAVALAVQATGQDGKVYQTTLATTAGLPIDVYDPSETCEVVEIGEPVAVSGCFAGGTDSALTSYSESVAETRNRTMALTYNSDFVWKSQIRLTNSNVQAPNSFTTRDGKTISSSQLVTNEDNEDSVMFWGLGTEPSPNLFSLVYFNGLVMVNGKQSEKGPLLFGGAWSENIANNDVSFAGKWNPAADNGKDSKEIIQRPIGPFFAAPFFVSNDVKPLVPVWTLLHPKPEDAEPFSIYSLNLLKNSHGEAAAMGSQLVKARRKTNKSRFRTDKENVKKMISEPAAVGCFDSNDTCRPPVSFAWSVDSSTLKDQVSTVPVLPGHAAVWYRQTERCQRKSYVLAYNKCGQSSVIGTAVMDDWKWSVELAQREGTCNEGLPPPKKLATASCALPVVDQCLLSKKERLVEPPYGTMLSWPWGV